MMTRRAAIIDKIQKIKTLSLPSFEDKTEFEYMDELQ
jgi:hypothetical protein